MNFDEARQPRREHAGLSRTGAGEDEQRTFGVEDGLGLGGIQAGKQAVVGSRNHRGKIREDRAPECWQTRDYFR